MPPAAAPKPPVYEVQERVFCMHGPMIYEAKILDIRKPADKKDPTQFKVHYKGWKNTWDEYVLADRLHKFNDDNRRLQKELYESNSAPRKSKSSYSGGASTPRQKHTSEDPAMASAPPRGQKRTRDVETELEEDFLKRTDVKITIPETLKAALVDDWENITKSQQLVPLPRDPNVREILKRYRDSVPRKRGGAESDIFDEVVAGLRLYFDKSLGTILLYRFERQQYLEIRKEHPEKEMSEIYGAEHLLRLCVTMPELLAHTNMDQQAMSKLRDHIDGFVRFLAKSPDQFIVQKYESASPRYIDLSKGAR